jgi:hypothetical protein
MPMTARRNARLLCDSLVMRTRSPVPLAGVGVSCTILAACAAGSSGGASMTGTYSAESGSATLSAQPGDCGMNPSFNIDAPRVARLASRTGIGAQSTPVDALRAVLTHGSMPYFGGSGGSGLVGMGFPAAGWTEVSAKGGAATFQAPLHSGTAKLTFTRVGSRWLLSHGEKDC